MAFKIFKKTNYFYIVDSVTDVINEGLAKDVKVKREKTDSTSFSFENVNGIQPTQRIAFADILDENGDAYTDLATFVAWYEDNTGFNVAGATALVTPFLSYSINETLTGGTWIDGRPIYRKVFERVFNGVFNNETENYFEDITIEHNLNIQEYLTAKIFAIPSNEGYQGALTLQITTTDTVINFININSVVYMSTNLLYIEQAFSVENEFNYYVLLEYVKT